MVKVTYVEHTGEHHVIEVPAGQSLMRGAVDRQVPGIVGECGGQMACGACHVFIDEPWLARAGTRSTLEEGMLAVSEHARATSRLACQIRASEILDGLIVHMPESQP
jgi:2Fe-2S ferredoxin